MTQDQQFLRWLHARLRDQHAENPNYDYMQKLIAIAEALPEGVDTPVMSPVPSESYYMPPIKLSDGEVLIALSRKEARRIHKAADTLMWAIGMSPAFVKKPKKAKTKFAGNPVIFDEAVDPDEIVFTNDEYSIKETYEPAAYPFESITTEIPLSDRVAKLMIDAMNKREDKVARKAEKRLKKKLADTPNVNSFAEPITEPPRHDEGMPPTAADRAFKHFQSNLQARSVNELGIEIHTLAKEKGWYEDAALERLIDDLDALHKENGGVSFVIEGLIRQHWPKRNLGEQLFLIVTELAEAFEEYRAGRPINEVYEDGGKPEGVPVEIADAIIRILDLTEYHGIKMGEVMRQKMDFNATRPHRHGGKLA
jgi:NTP pyrophosphatase (non-canonical NTP hydrolase)